MFTYDPGFMSTASCQSKITYIDGEAGILMHRGYMIQDLAAKSDYLEVAYLLLHGELPNSVQKAKFVYDVKHHNFDVSTLFRTTCYADFCIFSYSSYSTGDK
jgi:citrate synthase